MGLKAQISTEETQTFGINLTLKLKFFEKGAET